MEVDACTGPPPGDTVVAGLFAGDDGAGGAVPEALAPLVESGEARGDAGHLAVAHADGRRWLAVGLGPRADWDVERAREAAAAAHRRARELGAKHIGWIAPEGSAAGPVSGLVEGTVLAAHPVGTRRSSAPRPGVERLSVCVEEALHGAVARAAVVAAARNRARDLQNAPPNELTPEALAERARSLPGVEVEALDRAAIEAAGMGAFAAVARGSAVEPRLISVRYEPTGARGPLVAFVGKGVTYDSGGYSIKSRAGLVGMKFDMSGAAAVLEGIGALAELGVPARVLAVVGAAENLVSGNAMRPDDIVTTLEGLSVEITNTDAEGRLILADCLTWARRHGAERLIDVATLTGGVVTALGDVFAGLMASDDAWAAEVQAAAAEAGELVWRLPLHRRYGEAMRSKYADLVNSAPDRKAHALTASAFLRRFTGDVPWAHLDIAGVASDTRRPYARDGGVGWGVATLVALAERVAGASAGS